MIFKQIILLLLRVLCIFNISEETVRLLIKIFNKEASLLKLLNDIVN